MPFAVFRRHQRKMLVVIAILAIMGFVLSDSLYRITNQNSARYGNRVVADLYGKPIYRSDLDRLAEQRSVANRFLASLTGDPASFGTYSTRELIDAKILEREADRLGIPDTPEFAQGVLKRITERSVGFPLNKSLFEMALRPLGPDVSPTQVLACVASQYRLELARQVGALPVVTPLDVYQAYRDQHERSSFRFVSFPAANFLDKAGEPTPAEVEALYQTYKDVLPDPNRPTPGFKVPREVKLEILTADGAALARTIQEGLADADLRSAYEARKKVDYAQVSVLPVDLFQDDPKAELTPPLYIPFEEVKALGDLAKILARERAQEQIGETFAKIKDEALDKFSDAYQDAVAENADAKKNGESRTVPVPKPTGLEEVAKANGLAHQTTGLLTYDKAKELGLIGATTLGSNPMQPSNTKFADAVFAPKSPLFEGMEFSDPSGRRYLVRKLEDVAPHVAPLAEVRAEVAAAWKLDKARGLAEAAAKELAERVKKDGGTFKENLVAGRPVVAIEPVPRLRQGLPVPGNLFRYVEPSLTELPQIPNASGAIREAMFGLKPGSVAVEADAPRTTFYVLTLDRRDPATFAGLYGPGATSLPFQNQAIRDAMLAQNSERMEALRAQAGLKPGWVPPDEKDREDADQAG